MVAQATAAGFPPQSGMDQESLDLKWLLDVDVRSHVIDSGTLPADNIVFLHDSG